MNADLERLLSLQVADREIARLRQEIAALPQRISEVEAKLNSAKAQIEAAKARIKAGETARRKHEADIQAERQKISKYRDQSLDVKTNDQYKALMHEISFAEQAIREKEDKILETMVEAEEQEKVVRAAEAELKAQTAIIEREKAEVRARTEQDERELAEWTAKRNQLRDGINSDTLTHYDRVLRLRGSGVAEVRNGKCSACNVLLRPQELQEALSQEIVMTCNSCGRILVSTEAPAPGPAKVQPMAEASA
jgi:predicted  nucleic acid-binding Zn-ribbon protein